MARVKTFVSKFMLDVICAQIDDVREQAGEAATRCFPGAAANGAPALQSFPSRFDGALSAWFAVQEQTERRVRSHPPCTGTALYGD